MPSYSTAEPTRALARDARRTINRLLIWPYEETVGAMVQSSTADARCGEVHVLNTLVSPNLCRRFRAGASRTC